MANTKVSSSGSVKCYATIRKILKSFNPEDKTVVNEDNYVKICNELLKKSVEEDCFEKYVSDFNYLANFFAQRCNINKDPKQEEMLENLSKDIYSSIKDLDINVCFLGGLPLNMYTRAIAKDSTLIADRISGDIDIAVDELNLTKFLNSVNASIGISSVEDRRVLPPQERHINNFNIKGSPRSGPLVVVGFDNGVKVELFLTRQIEGKDYSVGYYPVDGSPNAFLRQRDMYVEDSSKIGLPPHTNSTFAFNSKINLNREKDFVDAYNLVASGCVTQSSYQNFLENFNESDPWKVSNKYYDNHTESASEEAIKTQEEHMGFNYQKLSLSSKENLDDDNKMVVQEDSALLA